LVYSFIQLKILHKICLDKHLNEFLNEKITGSFYSS